MSATTKTTAKPRAKKAAPKTAAEPEIAWGYGIRTWNADGSSHSGFRWDLTVGARTTAPDSHRAIQEGDR